MSRRTMAATLLVLVYWGVAASPPKGGDWAEQLFSEQGHDFGPVARGAKVRHPFVLTNRLAEPVNIVDVRASCGCTSGRASAATVAPGATAVVEAQMDTRSFVGPKATTLSVSLITASGQEAVAKFGLRCNILSDIVLNPGSVDFGSVAKGETPRLAMTLERVGSKTWRVSQVLANPSLFQKIDAKLIETARSEGGIVYTLRVSIRPDAPAGAIRDEIRIRTNDPESPVVPVLVTATVQGALTARPTNLDLGRVASAGGAQGRYLVSAKTPFRITSIEGNGDGFALSNAEPSARTVHILTLAYRPEDGQTRGDLRRRFRVQTDVPGEPPLELNASLRVDP